MSTDPLVRGRMAEELQNAVAGYFEIELTTFDISFYKYDHAVRLNGRFLTETEIAYDAIAARAGESGYLIFFRREGKEEVIYAVHTSLQPRKPNYPLAVILFIVTLMSVFFVSGVTQDLEIDWQSGFSYAIPLMLILLAHELGHFFVARHNHMATSPPYFIPLPISLFGTLGAVIFMSIPPQNRRHLLQMGAAGPLAGLVFAIPFLIYGLSISTIGPIPEIGPYLMEGNSLAYAGLKLLMFGQVLPANGLDVQLSNVAFAGWVGLFVTALNLIPAGQLDGGHAAYTLFGERIRPLTYILIAIFIALSFQFSGWLLWAFLLFFFGRTNAVPMDDLTPLDGKHKALAVTLLALGVLLFIPMPLLIVTP